MGQSLREKGWVVVDTWTTVFSEDNDCGFYCQHADAHYYTIGITNRLLNPTTIMAYVVQLHNGIYRFALNFLFNLMLQQRVFFFTRILPRTKIQGFWRKKFKKNFYDRGCFFFTRILPRTKIQGFWNPYKFICAF